VLLERLTLAHYRNYVRLDVRFAGGVIVLQGANAQGKTNLLEAIYLLATTKSSRTRSDADLITWGQTDPFAPTPFARITAHVARARGPVDLEIVVVQDGNDGTRPATGAPGTPGATGQTARKRFKVNGVPRRAGEMLGQVNAVLFAPTDVDIVAGSPTLRRRYLDVILCQVHPSYYRALQAYNKVLLQRNSLLRQIREHRQPAATLHFWNEQMVEHGTVVVTQRAEAVAHLAESAAEMHGRVSGGRERLQMTYVSSLPLEGGAAAGVRGAFEAELAAQHARELAAGVSLVGPHRDDLGFAVGGVDVTLFGSRGQQRSVALAIKLAELAYIRREAGEWPILLLDDATSELDAVRRAAVLELAREHPQVFLTTTELGRLGTVFNEAPQVWHIEAGTLVPRAP
jgi:DNA replication and repair protein RecF